jgi:flagella basal body P-ring formation protein FlgA
VDVLVDGERVSRAWARFEVFRGRPVVALTRDVRRGDILQALDVEVRAADGGGAFLTDPSETLGKRVVRSLRAGANLTAQDVEAVPVVERGDAVRLVARVGGVVASALGRALEPAGVGDSLRVENFSGDRPLVGVLREGGIVDVTGNYGR